MRVLHQHVRDLLHVFLGVAGAGRVRRAVQDDPFGLRRDRLFQIFRLQLEVHFLRAGDDDGLALGQQHHVRIRDPVGRRDDDFVARVERGHQRVVEHLLAAGADGDLVARIVEIVVAFELAADRVLQLGRTVRIGVAGVAALHGVDGGLDDVGRGVEIRLACGEADDVAARGFQLARLGADGDGGGRLDAAETVSDEAHYFLGKAG